MKLLKWIKDRLMHKISHFKLSRIMDILVEDGLALVLIIIGWEITEDVIFPILFVWLGTNVHPMFLVGAPASILLCLHWLMVPLLWGVWIKIKKVLILSKLK